MKLVNDFNNGCKYCCSFHKKTHSFEFVNSRVWFQMEGKHTQNLCQAISASSHYPLMFSWVVAFSPNMHFFFNAVATYTHRTNDMYFFQKTRPSPFLSSPSACRTSRASRNPDWSCHNGIYFPFHQCSPISNQKIFSSLNRYNLQIGFALPHLTEKCRGAQFGGRPFSKIRSSSL